jgi:hypothetical protein
MSLGIPQKVMRFREKIIFQNQDQEIDFFSGKKIFPFILYFV